MSKQLAEQQKNIFPYLLLTYLIPLLVLITALLVRKPMDFTLDMFTRDTNAVSGTHPFVGLISNMGVILWTNTTAICLFCGIILRFSSQNNELSSFLIFSGFITMLLMLDDFFQLHEVIYKFYFGINEVVVFAIYFVLLISDLFIFRRTILKTDYLILLSAAGFFGLSLLVDHFQCLTDGLVGKDIRILLEDGSKLFGIAGWFGYFARCGYLALKDIIKSNQP